MTTKFKIETIRGRKLATLTARADDNVIETVMAAAVVRLKGECARYGLAVASASTIEVQLSLFGEYADVTVSAFVTGAARKGNGSRRLARRIA